MVNNKEDVGPSAASCGTCLNHVIWTIIFEAFLVCIENYSGSWKTLTIELSSIYFSIMLCHHL